MVCWMIAAVLNAPTGVGESLEKPVEKTVEELVVEAQPAISWSGIGSGDRIDAETMQLLVPVHISELLARTPGVWISRGSGQEHLTAIRSPVLTGSGACGSFLFTVNRVPVRPTGFCNVNGLLEVHHEAAQHIDIARGPASSVFGGNALHGAIDLRMPSPAPIGRVDLDTGSDGFRRLRLSEGTRQMRLDVTLNHNDGWRDQTGYLHHKLSFALNHRVGRYAAETLIETVDLNQATAGYLVGTDAYKDAARAKTNANPEAGRDAWALRVHMLLSVPVATGLLTLTPYARKSAMDFVQHFLPGKPYEHNGHQSRGLAVEFNRALERSEIHWGGSLESARISLREFQPEPLTEPPDCKNAVRPQGAHYDYHVHSIGLAHWVSLAVQVDPALRVQADARVERVKYDYDNRMLDGRTAADGTECGFGGCYYSRPPNGKDSFSDLALRVGFSRELQPMLSLFGSLATAFRPPQVTELYRLRGGQTLSAIDSESQRSLEVGLRFNWSEHRLQLSAYNARKRDYIYRDAANYYFSDGRSRHAGLEWLLQMHFDGAGKAVWDWRFVGSRNWHRYDFTRALEAGERITSGDEMDTAPEWMASSVLGRSDPRGYVVELEVQWQGSYYTDAANAHHYDGHTLAHLRLRWDIDPVWRVRARITNLLDTAYADRADYSSFQGDRYFPGAPRQFFTGATYHYR